MSVAQTDNIPRTRIRSQTKSTCYVTLGKSHRKGARSLSLPKKHTRTPDQIYSLPSHSNSFLRQLVKKHGGKRSHYYCPPMQRVDFSAAA